MPNKLRTSKFSKPMLLVFLLVFAVAGIVVWKIFAAPSHGGPIKIKLPTLEAESMHLPRYTKVFKDPGANSGKAVFIYAGHSKMTGTFDAKARVTGFSVVARDTSCAGQHPSMNITIARGSHHAIKRAVVRSKPYKIYTLSNLNIPSGPIKVTIAYKNSFSAAKRCYTNLYLDAIFFAYKADFGEMTATKGKKKVTNLSAQVNTHSASVEDCYFEYGLDTNYGSRVPCSPLPHAARAPQTVTAVTDRLQKKQTYNFRLCIRTAGVRTCSPNQTFIAGQKDKNKNNNKN